MSRALQIAVVLVLVALAPLRGFAGVPVWHAGSEKVTAAHAAHGDSHAHEHAPQDNGHDRASDCMEHCASMLLVSPVQLHLPAEASDRRIAFVARAAPAFFPDPLDPPPLAG